MMRGRCDLQSITFRVLLAFAFLALVPGARAAFLHDVPQHLQQPDGTVVDLLASGDEYYNWVHDARGFVILRDPSSGYLVYAVKHEGTLIASTYVVGEVDPAAVGIEPNLRPDRAVMPQAHELWLANEAARVAERRSASAFAQLANIVVFIRFSDDTEFSQSRPIASYDATFNSTSTGANSVRNFFFEASYGITTVVSNFFPLPVGGYVVSYQDTNARAYYMPYDATTNPKGYTDNQRAGREYALLGGAIKAIASQVPSDLVVDYNGDGRVDNMCFVVKGAPTAWDTLLWPHRTQLGGSAVSINGKRVLDYNLTLETYASPGTLCHELTHTQGAPDLYHYASDSTYDPVGIWDLMDGTTEPPQHMGAYLKYRYLGWIADVPEITADGRYTLNPLISATNNCFKIASPNAQWEYFFLEYRKKAGRFESGLPGSGLLVYRIDPIEIGNAEGPPDEVYLYRPGGSSTSSGALANAYFSSDVGRTAINGSTDPFPLLGDGTLGGLSISNIGSAGDTIPFTVTIQSPCSLQGFDVVSPLNNASLPGFSVTLTWAAAVGASSYDVYFGTDKVPAFYANTTQTSLTADVNPGTRYYWRVVAKADCGQLPSNSGVLVFTMQSVTVIQVKRNVPVTDLSDGTADDWKYYKLVLANPAANLTFSTAGGTGNIDLFVRNGFLPTAAKNDCASTGSGNTEACSFAQAAAGTWYVGLHAVAPYSGVTLLANYSLGSAPHRRVHQE